MSSNKESKKAYGTLLEQIDIEKDLEFCWMTTWEWVPNATSLLEIALPLFFLIKKEVEQSQVYRSVKAEMS